jgi:hypothetical protein
MGAVVGSDFFADAQAPASMQETTMNPSRTKAAPGNVLLDTNTPNSGVQRQEADLVLYALEADPSGGHPS